MKATLLALALVAGTAQAQAPTAAEISGNTTLADRPRGASVTDGAGAPLGVVQDSTASLVVVATGGYKVQMPASAVTKTDAGLSVGMTKSQLDTLFANAAAFQEKTHQQDAKSGVGAPPSK